MFNPSGPLFESVVATYTCNDGYLLMGDDMMRTCGSERMWSGSEPTCERK